MSKKGRILAICAGAAVAAGIAAAAASGAHRATTPGLTANEIKIGGTFPLTGFASLYKTIPAAVMALARLDLPGLVLYSGTINPGRYRDRDVTLQDVLTVFAPAQGLPTLTGDMLQTAAQALSGPLSGQKFGRKGARLRFFATGLGALTDAAKPNSQLEIAGNWSIE